MRLHNVFCNQVRTTGLAVRLSSRSDVKALHRRSPGGGGSQTNIVPSMLLIRTFSRSGILQGGSVQCFISQCMTK